MGLNTVSIRVAHISFVLLLSACTVPPPATVEIATDAEVANCEYVKNISTTPGLFGALAEPGIEEARQATLRSAEASGANTIVFAPVEPDVPVYRLEAVAYRC